MFRNTLGGQIKRKKAWKYIRLSILPLLGEIALALVMLVFVWAFFVAWFIAMPY